MKKNKTLFGILVRLWKHIHIKRRKNFLWLLFLMLIVSFAEFISLGSVLPFLLVIMNPDQLLQYSFTHKLTTFFSITYSKQLILPLTILFISASLIAGALRLILLWASTKLSFYTGAEINMLIFRRTLYQPYNIHCSRNSSEIIDSIANKSGIAIGTINYVANILSSIFILIGIFVALLYFNPLMTFLSFSAFGVIYASIIYMTRKKILIDSERISKQSTLVIKSLQESLGGIRDILIDGTQEIYCNNHRNADLLLRKAQSSNLFIGNSPRYVIEALGMSIIGFLAYKFSGDSSKTLSIIPLLGALALGAQRMLPALQQAYTSFIGIKGSQSSLLDVVNLLEQPMPKINTAVKGKRSLSFKKSIRIKNLNFRYSSNDPYILNDINLSFSKGSHIGFVGKTGSGKSTLLDLIMGLLDPTNGSIEIDGQIINSKNKNLWQSNISHVPQNIFLIDSSVAENIAFGVEKDKIDMALVMQSAEKACIASDIATWNQGYQTLVGERGVRLSGGQRQRIGIARALYKKSEVIILDEATSALDNKTEQYVIASLEKDKDITLLIVAHRLTTLKNCDKIVEIENGSIKHKKRD